MQKHIHISDIDKNLTAGRAALPDGCQVVCFDTGLDPRSFARTKMSQSLEEQGYVVNPDGTHEVWKPSGVNEINLNAVSSDISSLVRQPADQTSSMRVWGPLFSGERLDLLLKAAPQDALQAVVCWIRAKLFLGEKRSALNPGAAFICDGKNPSHQIGTVFFAPENLSNRCLLLEKPENEPDNIDSSIDLYNCPGLPGIDAAAFCAGVMLYKILTGAFPFLSKDIYQDMRDGVFKPIHLAVPALDEKLAALIQAALRLSSTNLSAQKKHSSFFLSSANSSVNLSSVNQNGTEILAGFLEILIDSKVTCTLTAVNISSLFNTVSEEKTKQVEKEIKLYQLKQNYIVKTKRFVARNRQLLTGITIAFVFALIILLSAYRTISQRPTTEGLTPEGVIIAYFEAFSSLDHVFMAACIQGADRNDIEVAASFYAVLRTRQAFEAISDPLLVPASVLEKQGITLPARNAFGVTELTVEHLSGSETGGLINYRANYLLWFPGENSINRSDILTLRLDRRGNWRIIEILRR
jgi:serine/threonine protein kinase